MRIISGLWKGRRIQVSNDIKARPTTDFAKEGLFNLLNNEIDFEDLEVLDLFSGTGSISFEFISRGAQNSTAIEMNDKHCQYIRKAASILKTDKLILIKADVFRFLTSSRKQYDLIFADPPYDLKNLEEIPGIVFSKQLLKQDGLLVFEHSSKHDFSKHPHFASHRAYGNVNFSFFKNQNN